MPSRSRGDAYVMLRYTYNGPLYGEFPDDKRQIDKIEVQNTSTSTALVEVEDLQTRLVNQAAIPPTQGGDWRNLPNTNNLFQIWRATAPQKDRFIWDNLSVRIVLPYMANPQQLPAPEASLSTDAVKEDTLPPDRKATPAAFDTSAILDEMA